MKYPEMRRAGIRSYYVRQWAVSGTMLGGVRENQSSRLELESQAQSHLDQWLEANETAGRDVDAIVESSESEPDIDRAGALIP